jgi:hypothetical protein
MDANWAKDVDMVESKSNYIFMFSRWGNILVVPQAIDCSFCFQKIANKLQYFLLLNRQSS